MYKRILVPVENSSYDAAILTHVEQLARENDAAIVLIHVADGWAARHFDELKLRESEEIQGDREYLGKLCDEMVQRGFETRARLAMGDPATQLVNVAAEEAVDLIAMSTHGHRFLNDLLRGSTADRVRHNVKIPVLMVRA